VVFATQHLASDAKILRVRDHTALILGQDGSNILMLEGQRRLYDEFYEARLGGSRQPHLIPRVGGIGWGGGGHSLGVAEREACWTNGGKAPERTCLRKLTERFAG
jgi:hypothetical protein